MTRCIRGIDSRLNRPRYFADVGFVEQVIMYAVDHVDREMLSHLSPFEVKVLPIYRRVLGRADEQDWEMLQKEVFEDEVDMDMRWKTALTR